MPDTRLTIHIGGSSFENIEPQKIQPWRALLDCADSIGLSQSGVERVRVDLGGLRRWIAFERTVGASPLTCIGYQETVGAIRQGDNVIGGSNRQVLCWLYPSGRVLVGLQPR